MKSFLSTTFFITVAFLSCSASASAYMVGDQIYSTIGTYGNPIYVQNADSFATTREQDLLNALNREMENTNDAARAQREALNNAAAQAQLDQAMSQSRNLQRAQGCEAQNAAIDSYKTKMSTASDFADPRTKKENAQYLNYLLEIYNNCAESSVTRTTRVDEEKICADNFGPKRTSVSHSSDGRLICGCNSGYEWYESRKDCFLPTPKALSVDEFCQNQNKGQGWKYNEATGKCGCASGYYQTPNNECALMPKTPPPPTPTNNEICQDAYGKNSNWDGTKNNEGGLNCGCKVGYEWNRVQTQCVSAPKTNSKETDEVSFQNSKDQACQESYGEHSFSKSGGCGCMVGYSMAVNRENSETGCVLDTVNEQKITVETPKIETPIQHKSFWARIKAWFGYD